MGVIVLWAGTDDHLIWVGPVVLNLEELGLTHLESVIRVSKDPTKILVKILAKIFASILQDLQGLNKDLSKILKGSCLGSFKDLSKGPQGFGQDLFRILVKIFTISLQGSFKILED